MQRSLRYSLSSLALAVALPLAVGCGETSTPTEPIVVPAAPTPTPIPTVVPGQSADMSGTVHPYSCPSCVVEGVVVSCQGRETVSARDGSYSLSGLASGNWTATARWMSSTDEETYEETYDFAVTLMPGSNTVNVVVYLY